MKHNHWLALLASGAVGWMALNLAAEETAVVRAERVNVRGKPSTLGEVITQLKQGETVTVLEEITVQKPKTGEPAKWARIKMPENTPLWVNAGLVDATNKTVKVARLNVRAGAGENYSVVGRLEKGAVVKEIRVVEDWMEIETPANAYAFVAADLIAKNEPPAAPAEPAKTAEAPKPATPPPIAPPPVTERVKTEPPLSVPVETRTVAAPAQTPPPTPEPARPAPVRYQPAPAVAAPAPAPAPVEPKFEAAPTKRIVRREGYVRRTVSIQAPTDFELRSAESGVALDYLHSSSANLTIKKFKGKKVIVSGEEFMDARWPNRPVLEIDTIQVAP